MAELRLLPLNEVYSASQLKTVKRQLAELGIDELPMGDDDCDLDFEESLTEDQLTGFMDRLDAHDAACDLYVPVEFDGTFELGDQSVGSVYTLVDALEELRAELDIDEDASEEEDGEIDMEVIEEQLRYAWRAFLRAAHTSIERQAPLHVIS